MLFDDIFPSIFFRLSDKFSHIEKSAGSVKPSVTYIASDNEHFRTLVSYGTLKSLWDSEIPLSTDKPCLLFAN